MLPIKNTVATRYPAIVTYALIAVNCLMFLYQQTLSPRELELFLSRYALIPALYFGPYAEADSLADYLPFLTNTFLHGGWLHLILNMWTLWLFAPTVEDRMGPVRFLAFYLVCGVLASATHAVFNATSTVPALGASGAIAGVLGCYMALFPLARVVVVVPIIFIPLFFELPAFVFVGFWFLMQLLQGAAELLAPPTGGGVAWWAHIGGFVVGLLVGPLLVQPERRYRTYYADEGILGFTPRGH
jgi:membrane associated rhomboid family serine protease